MPRMRKKDIDKSVRLIEEGKIKEGIIMCISRKCPYCNREVYLIYWKDHNCIWRKLEKHLLDLIKDLTQGQAEDLVSEWVYLEGNSDGYEDRSLRNIWWSYVCDYMEKNNLEFDTEKLLEEVSCERKD